jgi:hypothetical protein
MLTFQQFFQRSSQPDFFESFKIVNFVTPLFHPLFFSALLDFAKKSSKRPVTLFDLTEHTATAIRSQLEMSFLGNSSCYILTPGPDLASLDSQLSAYLATYTGIHQLILFTKPEEQLDAREGIIFVNIDATLDRELYRIVLSWKAGEASIDLRFVDELFRRTETVALDVAIIMMHYQLLLGKNSEQFFAKWFDRIIVPKKSLFILSQYLFAGDVKRFYSAWPAVAQDYPIEFWLAFWSEQLWQAIIFITTARREDLAAAKKLVSRLPFSFMQKDWQRFSPEVLISAHNQLYQIDYAQKNGAITDGLELWYAKVLNG